MISDRDAPAILAALEQLRPQPPTAELAALATLARMIEAVIAAHFPNEPTESK